MHADDADIDGHVDSHIDEGTIHAWLDGALSDADAERVDAHVHGCRECRDAVAEARGFIAGASRVVGLLDDEPAATVKPVDTSAWRFLRVTPARASIAAALIVAVGLTFTRPRAAVESMRMEMDSASTTSAIAPAAAPPAVAPEMMGQAPTSPRDTVLASAVGKRVAMDHPTRVLRASPEPAVVAAAPAPAPSVAMGREASSAVTTGMAVQRVAATTANEAPADKLRASAPGVSARASTGECYRIEGPGSPDWKGVPLPVTIQLSNAFAAGGTPGAPRFGVTAPGGERMVGSYLRSGAGIRLELVGETAVTTGQLRDGTGSLTAAGKAIDVRGTRVSCR